METERRRRGGNETWNTQTVIDEVSGGENVGQADGEELAWIEGAPGYGWLTNPKKAAYNRVYNRTSISWASLLRKLFR